MELTCAKPDALCGTDDLHVAGDIIASKYRLVRKIGRGGYGVVWEAIHTTIGLSVALKFCALSRGNDALCARLRREAQVAAMLSHSAVVRVYDYGETSPDGPFLVMEMLEGETLGDLLDRKGRLSPEAAVGLLLPVASGVEAAHLRGIVHRDLKPENIVITRDNVGRDRPKVVDFGVATALWFEEDEGGWDAGAVVGTPNYMAPEQALAFKVDHRADVWAFSVLLYETLCGQTPFDCVDYLDAISNSAEERVPSLVERAGIDAALWRILEKGLQRDLKVRWSSMGELGQALAGWLLAQGIEEDASGTSLRAQWLSETRAPFPSRSPSHLRDTGEETLAAEGCAAVPSTRLRQNPADPPASREVMGAAKSARAVSPAPRRLILVGVLALSLTAFFGVAVRKTRVVDLIALMRHVLPSPSSGSGPPINSHAQR